MKSSFSNSQGTCVDVWVDAEGLVNVRDTKLGENSPVLKFTQEEWDAFTMGVYNFEFDYEELERR